jgi:tRNA dimethylallyltransferase
MAVLEHEMAVENEHTAAPILVILGATGSGKSSLAIHIARAVGRCEILSVDSMAIYQNMDIGTAKSSLAERYEIPHHLVDWLRPDEAFSAARFVSLADNVIADAARRGVHLIATGGTPMYFKALFEGLFEGPTANAALRARLGEVSDGDLHARLAEVDPAAAQRIHAADRKRLVRALEVFELSGQPISTLQQQWQGTSAPRHPAVWIGLHWDKPALNQRINARVKDMIAAGWLDEVRALVRQFPDLSSTAVEATGYRTLIDHVNGELSLADAIEEIKIATRQLARRQMKWFRRFPNVYWLPGDREISVNVAEAVELWNRLPSPATVADPSERKNC